MIRHSHLQTTKRAMPGLLLLVLSVLSCYAQAVEERTFYTAAVFEHARFDSDNGSLIVETNLDYYRRAAQLAKAKGADVIVFPEYGIFPPGNRSELKEYLENTPDPKLERINPCEDGDQYKGRPILHALSCMAKDNSLVVVANSGDIQNCTGQDQCPADGVFHFNTNVVFDRDGTLLVRYHKEHLFFELGMDLAREQQDTTFVTDFGKFATYICFDIDFARMGEVGRLPDVDAVFFPTMWLDIFPQFVSVQFWQSWAMGNAATLVAANIQIPGYFAVGSGIFDGQNGAVAYTFNPDGISKLVVANVRRPGRQTPPANASITAISATDSWDFKDDGKDVPTVCSRTLLNDTKDIYHEYRCLESKMGNYTFAKLSEASGRVEACNNGMCCSLDYSTSGLGDEHFYLGVFNGTYNSFDRYFWCEEICVLARCDAHDGVPCGVFPMKADTVFQYANLKANFTSEIVYPQVVSSGMRLVPVDEWHQHSDDPRHEHHRPNHPDSEGSSKRSVHFENSSGRNLISIGLAGRCYAKDPPYVR